MTWCERCGSWAGAWLDMMSNRTPHPWKKRPHKDPRTGYRCLATGDTIDPRVVMDR